MSHRNEWLRGQRGRRDWELERRREDEVRRGWDWELKRRREDEVRGKYERITDKERKI